MLVEKNMHTFFGYGVTNAFKAFEDYRAKFDVLEPVNNPHNVILSMFIMFGLIFTIFFLIFFISLLIKGWRYSSRAKERNTKMFYGFLFASTFSIFIQGVTDSAIIMPEYYVMPPFLLSLGLLFLFTRQKNKFTYN
jgi:O-antigen ligase